MFAQLKERLTDKLRQFGDDDLDRKVGDLVARGTSEDLIAPEWSVNLALVDMVNQNPTVMSEKLLKALRRVVSKHNTKVQILSLTILETCVKNCHPAIYAALGTSELWLELAKMAADTSVTRVDADVRDKILCMVEDYAKVLPQNEFKETYDTLLEHGVDFPARGPQDQPPILTPPATYQPPTVVPGGATAGLGNATAGAAAGQAVEDPFAGMSEEDRAAVQTAMAEMEAEEHAVRESAAVAASATIFQQMGLQQQQQQPEGAALQPQQQQHRPPLMPVADPGPVLPDNTEDALQVMSNTTGLLNEMLASEADPREPFVVELAEQCVKLQSKLEEMISGLTDEAQLASALVHHEALQGAISKYDEHLAKAEQGAAVAAPAAGLQQRPVDASSMLAAASAATAAAHGEAAGGAMSPGGTTSLGGAGPNFTLLSDDEDEEDSGMLLSSKRNPGGPPAEPFAMHAVPDAAAPVTSAGIDLIDLDPLAPVVQQQQPPHQQQLEDLLAGLTTADGTEQAAAPAAVGPLQQQERAVEAEAAPELLSHVSAKEEPGALAV